MAASISNHRFSKLIIIIALLALLVAFAAMIHTVTQNNSLGADYATFWVAGRAMFLEHQDPYSQAVTEQAQMGKMGRLAQPGEDQLAYAYPPYGLLAILPTAWMTYAWASSFWLAFNILAFLITLFIVLPPAARGLGLTALLFFHIILNFILGQFDILTGIGILLFFGLVAGQGKRSTAVQVLTGILLAWDTIKPQFIWLVLAFALLFALRERLKPFLIAFFAALGGFFLFSFLLVPAWLVEWPHRVQEYTQYVRSQPVLSEFLDLFLPAQASLVVTGIIFLLCLAFTVFLLARWWKGRLDWLPMLAWLGMLTYLFHLHGISYEQFIFLIPLILWAGWQRHRPAWPFGFFWFGAIVVSWLGFVLGRSTVAFDRAPVLFNLIWVIWLMIPQFDATHRINNHI